MITATRLRELLECDIEAGTFRWRETRGSRAIKGAAAGTRRWDGYYVLRLDGRLYLRHRLVWLYAHGAWPKETLDHANRVKGEDRLANLREATRPQNHANVGLQRNNKSGFRGVHQLSGQNVWVASIKNRGKAKHLGRFGSAEAAATAYNAALEQMHGEYAHISGGPSGG